MANRRFVGEDAEPQPNYFKAWRVHRGYRQNDVEKILGMRSGRVSTLERGTAVYTRHVLQALARVYGCTTAQLLDEPPPGKSINQGSLDKQAAIAAANLTQVIELTGRLQAAATMLRDRVMPQIDALLLDLTHAGDAADAVIAEAERLAGTFAEYGAKRARVPTSLSDTESELGRD